jgi:hypothetical protein
MSSAVYIVSAFETVSLGDWRAHEGHHCALAVLLKSLLASDPLGCLWIGHA